MDNNNMDNNPKKPKFYITFKILGLVALISLIVGIVLMVSVVGNKTAPSPGDIMLLFLLIAIGVTSPIFFLIGFGPEISKLSVKSAKYIQSDNKEDLTSMANTGADISSDAITKVAQSVKTGLSDKKYCRHCGGEIEADSKFCKHCGKSLD